HWVGDIHQPLHVSFADDRGGNFIRESGPCVNSLHTVWDTCIIEKKLGTDPQTIAQDLLDGPPDSDRAAWIAVPVEGWGERVLPGHAPEVSAVLRQSGHEMLLSARERNVLRGQGREGRHRRSSVSRTARPVGPGSAEARGHPVGAPIEDNARTVDVPM